MTVKRNLLSENKKKESKTWLVTGAAGFLGSHTVECLLNQGMNVIGLDNLSWGIEKNLEFFKSNPSFTFVKCDIRKENDLREVFKTYSPDAIVHLAALHFIPDAMKNPALTLDINVTGTQSLLTVASESKVKALWFASTGDVYAPSEASHLEEDLIKPFNIYGMSKFIGENLIRLHSDAHPEMKFVVGRIFNLYGSRETNPHILPEIIKQLKSDLNAPLKLGSIWPKRDLVPIQDAARVIFESLSRSQPGVTTVNVSTGATRSIEEVLKVIAELLDIKLNIQHDPSRVRPVERAHLQGDIKKLTKLIGWAPHTDIRKGLLELLSGEGLITVSQRKVS